VSARKWTQQVSSVCPQYQPQTLRVMFSVCPPPKEQRIICIPVSVISCRIKSKLALLSFILLLSKRLIVFNLFHFRLKGKKKSSCICCSRAALILRIYETLCYSVYAYLCKCDFDLVSCLLKNELQPYAFAYERFLLL